MLFPTSRLFRNAVPTVSVCLFSILCGGRRLWFETAGSRYGARGLVQMLQPLIRLTDNCRRDHFPHSESPLFNVVKQRGLWLLQPRLYE